VGLVAPSSSRPGADRRRFAFDLAGLGVAVALAAGCHEAPLASIDWRLVGAPTTLGGTCPPAPPDAPPAFAGATSVRLTFRDASGLRCDALLPIGTGKTPVIDVPDRAAPVDAYAEYFDASGTLLGRGQQIGVDLAAGGTVDVGVLPARAFACAMGREARPRAFHSATLLPTGEVLLVGGLGPSDAADPRAPFDPSAGLFVTATAELYRPASGTFLPLTIAGLTPRAFHQAYVSQDAAGIHVALVGGVGVSGDPLTTPAFAANGAYRWTPTAMAQGAADEVLDYDPVGGTFTRRDLPAGTDVRGRILGALPPGGAAPPVPYAGGVDAAGAALVSFDLYGGAAPATGALRRPRVGATATPLDAARVVEWGGDIGAAPTEAGELLGGLPAAPAAQPLTITAGGGDRAFHAAALTGAGLVVVAGGFAVSGASATTAAASPGVELTFAGTTVTGADVGGPAGGYPAAIVLSDGDVLATGGDPDGGTASCADATGIACALDDAWRYPSAGGAGVQQPPMQVARYGHRMTTLADGTVLVTGGLAGARLGTPGQVAALLDAERYEWRGAADDPIADLAPAITRAPGDVARDAGGMPAFPCSVIAEQ
jgi:hypothetical protein